MVYEPKRDGVLRCRSCEGLVADAVIVDGPQPFYEWLCAPCLNLEAEGKLPGLTRKTRRNLFPGERVLAQSPIYHLYKVEPSAVFRCGFNNHHALAVFSRAQIAPTRIPCHRCKAVSSFTWKDVQPARSAHVPRPASGR